MQQKAHFLTAIPQAMTEKLAGHAPVPPVMSRSSVTDAAPARTSHGNYTGAMLMREHITINLNFNERPDVRSSDMADRTKPLWDMICSGFCHAVRK